MYRRRKKKCNYPSIRSQFALSNLKGKGRRKEDGWIQRHSCHSSGRPDNRGKNEKKRGGGGGESRSMEGEGKSGGKGVVLKCLF